MPSDNTLLLEDAVIVLRNFQGLESKYNQAGNRNFGVLLEPELAERMAADGWNVKWFRVKEEGDEPQAWLSVRVKYGKKPPKVVVLTSTGRKQLTEETIGSLDFAEIETVDLIVNPSFWEVNGKSGVKAYLKSMFVTIKEDALERKYTDV